MGKREKKTGKGRLDKYYKLAKEQGYRARSAFKLIQLDKKYDFLRTARCTIDLCAAPGGWLQVASKYMPPNSIILGVDLVPIKPIPRCVTFAEDITTDKCRKKIRDEIRDWKADVVLHDGAPNVGTAWAQDAFTQSELVLSSLKLATEFLNIKGTFVTKIFRSKDYNSLLWVFNQLFEKVEATKPPSSRNVSAEIFVVCTGYLAPKRIDPKLLNPSHVFKDLDVMTATQAAENANKDAGSTTMDKLTPAAFNVFHPEKKRRAREGYDEGDYTLFKRSSIMDFIKANDPIAILGTTNQLDFNADDATKELLKNEKTTEDIRSSAHDLKVLGKKDFKNLLKWRGQIREELGLDVKIKPTEEFTETAEVQPLDEEEQMALDIERLETEATAAKRKARRKANEKKNRNVQRMQLNMTTPMDVGIEAAQQDRIDGGDVVFDLAEVEGGRGARKSKKVRLEGNEADEYESSEEGDFDLGSAGEEDEEVFSDEEEQRLHDLENNLDTLYDEYQNAKLAKDAKHRVKEARKKRDAENGLVDKEWGGIKKGGEGAGSGDEEDMSDNDDEDSGVDDTMAYLDRDENAVPADELDSDDEEDEENRPPAGSKKRGRDGNLLQELKRPKQPLESTAKSRATAMWFDQAVFKGLDGLEDLENAQAKDEEAKSSDVKGKTAVELDEEPALAPKKRKGKHAQSNPATWDEDGEEPEEAGIISKEQADAQRIADYGLTTPEAMTLAQQLVNREKTATQLIDEGFNRHAFNDKDGLPTWFLDDEMKHFRTNVPVTKEAIEAIRVKMRALNARPIKKVAEAKARKKMKAIKRLTNAQKKADVINETEDMTEQEKAASIQRLVNRATKAPTKSKKEEIKYVVARGANKGTQGRPKGVKGRFRMVDSRGKKEVRAAKRIAKRDGGSRRRK